MKQLTSLARTAVITLLAVVSPHLGAQTQSISATQSTAQTAPARATKSETATPQASGSLTAPPAVAASAACCKKTCSAGSSFCGKECSIVDSLSECSGEQWNNITFECPANKGMSCNGSTCSCQ